MKLIIAGSRELSVTWAFIEELVMKFKLQPNEILSGDANGIDLSGIAFAKAKGLIVSHFPPDYSTFYENPTYAPIARNKQMAEAGDVLLLIWNGKSHGSGNMKYQMEKLGKPVYEVIISEPTR